MALLASPASTLPDTAVAQDRERFREEVLGETADRQRMGARLRRQANKTEEWKVGIAVSVPLCRNRQSDAIFSRPESCEQTRLGKGKVIKIPLTWCRSVSP